MTVVTLNRGAITVTDAPGALKERLTYWKRELTYDRKRHMRTVEGHYENLFSEAGNILTTLPGFGHRILETLRKKGTPFSVVDSRLPLPKPDYEKACKGLRDYQLEPVIQSVMSGGGILSAATGFGKTVMTSAIIRAFDPEELKLRGTPTVVFAAPDKDINRKNYEELKKFLPDREVGLVMSGVKKFSDDVQVITLDSLHLLNPDEVGILIVDEVHSAASTSRAESISRFHKAARWGVSATPGGRFDGGDLLLEGLFGPVVCRRTYQDAVRLGALVPIEVYWVKAPPPASLATYKSYKNRDYKIKAAIVNNKEYSRLVADLIRAIPESKSVLCFTQWIAQMANIHAFCPEVSYVHAQTSEGVGSIEPISSKQRKEIYARMKDGELRKMLATHCWKQGVDFEGLDIVINASGGGSDISSKQIPGRASRKADGKDKAYMVDFIHEWDWDETGTKRKPGPLLSSDYSRRKSYKELGFEQHFVDSINELPFLKEKR
jgi:superfamily II DNA or RNA helicase